MVVEQRKPWLVCFVPGIASAPVVVAFAFTLYLVFFVLYYYAWYAWLLRSMERAKQVLAALAPTIASLFLGFCFLVGATY